MNHITSILLYLFLTFLKVHLFRISSYYQICFLLNLIVIKYFTLFFLILNHICYIFYLIESKFYHSKFFLIHINTYNHYFYIYMLFILNFYVKTYIEIYHVLHACHFYSDIKVKYNLKLLIHLTINVSFLVYFYKIKEVSNLFDVFGKFLHMPLNSYYILQTTAFIFIVYGSMINVASSFLNYSAIYSFPLKEKSMNSSFCFVLSRKYAMEAHILLYLSIALYIFFIFLYL